MNYDNNEKGMGSFMAGVIGAAIGAAAAIWISDRRNQRMIKGKINDIKDQVQQKREEINRNIGAKKREMEEKMGEKTGNQYQEEYKK